MREPSFDLQQAHRWFAVEYNNTTWDFLETSDRSDAESEEMIHRAHAAFLHWKEVGAPINTLRAYNLLTYVYAMKGDGKAALHYSDLTIRVQQDDPKGLTDWDVALIYDAAARAYDASGNKEKAEEYKAKAKEAGEEIQGDRDVFMATFKM